MLVDGGKVRALIIMVDNDIFQTKYVAGNLLDITLSSTSIGDSVHIVIEDVTKNMGTTWRDAIMTTDPTKISINDGSDPDGYGTWTSTIEPDNVTVELNCEIVDNSTDVIVAKCISETTWSKSVFNRIPIFVESVEAYIGYGDVTNYMLFGTDGFKHDGSVPSGWNEYKVDGSGSNLTIGEQLTIKGLPESFVNHWVDMGAKAWMGDDFAMLVPPE